MLRAHIAITDSLSGQLEVSQSATDSAQWNWIYLLHTGEVIADGTMPSRIAAQVVSQRAHESWLNRDSRRLGYPPLSPYEWEEVE